MSLRREHHGTIAAKGQKRRSETGLRVVGNPRDLEGNPKVARRGRNPKEDEWKERNCICPKGEKNWRWEELTCSTNFTVDVVEEQP